MQFFSHISKLSLLCCLLSFSSWSCSSNDAPQNQNNDMADMSQDMSDGDTTPDKPKVVSLLVPGPKVFETKLSEQTMTWLQWSQMGLLGINEKKELLFLDRTEKILGDLAEIEADSVLSAELLPIEQGGAKEGLLVSTNKGMFVLKESVWEESPLNGFFGTWYPHMLRLDASDSWMSNDLGVHHHDGETLSLVGKGAMGQGPWVLASGPAVPESGGKQSIWVGSSGGVYGIVRLAKGFEIYTSLSDQKVTALGATSDGLLWALVEGDVVRRDRSGEWAKLTIEGDAVSVLCHEDATDVWIRTTDDKTYHHASGSLSPVEGDLWSDIALVDAMGRLVIKKTDGVYAVDRRYRASIAPFGEDRRIDAPTPIDITFTFSEDLERVVAKVDGVEIPWNRDEGALMLDPAAVGAGSHTLTIEAYFANQPKPAIAARSFFVGPFQYTWKDHVQPLFEAKCKLCHDVRANRELYTREQWEENFAKIYEQSEQGLMPLPPYTTLNELQLRMLQQWKDAGFQ